MSFGSRFELGEVGISFVLVILDDLAGVDDSSIAGSELRILVESFATGLASFNGRLNAFEGFREAGFEGGLASGRFADQGGQMLVASGFEPRADLAEFGDVPLLRDPFLFQTGEFGLRGEDICVFGLSRFVNRDFHSLEVGVGLLDVLLPLRDELAQLLV